MLLWFELWAATMIGYYLIGLGIWALTLAGLWLLVRRFPEPDGRRRLDAYRTWFAVGDAAVFWPVRLFHGLRAGVAAARTLRRRAAT